MEKSILHNQTRHYEDSLVDICLGWDDGVGVVSHPTLRRFDTMTRRYKEEYEKRERRYRYVDQRERRRRRFLDADILKAKLGYENERRFPVGLHYTEEELAAGRENRISTAPRIEPSEIERIMRIHEYVALVRKVYRRIRRGLGYYR